jgi:hypothetical protein
VGLATPIMPKDNMSFQQYGHKIFTNPSLKSEPPLKLFYLNARQIKLFYLNARQDEATFTIYATTWFKLSRDATV